MKNLLLTLLLLCCLPLIAGGCITAHEATVELQVIDFSEGGKLDGCFFLAVESRSVDKVGSWWIVGQDKTAPMIPRKVTLRKIDSGEKIHQSGQVVVLVGPYVKDHAIGYDYWIFHSDYQPANFQDIRLERDYAAGKPVKISMEREIPGDEYSDDKVLDGARKLLEIKDFLSPTDSTARELFQQVRSQVAQIRRHSRRARDINDAKKLAQQLEKCIEQFTSVQNPAKSSENPATNPEK
ncbi:MAG: hypothetical protein KAR11_07710 [Phycisphaerae bacterium]|nr:hypothetical protein [Phycisphaerae bacterium]